MKSVALLLRIWSTFNPTLVNEKIISVPIFWTEFRKARMSINISFVILVLECKAFPKRCWLKIIRSSHGYNQSNFNLNFKSSNSKHELLYYIDLTGKPSDFFSYLWPRLKTKKTQLELVHSNAN